MQTGAPIIAADIGGTHARFGLVAAPAKSGAPAEILAARTYKCRDHATLSSIIETFRADANVPADIGGAAIACAGYIDGDRIIATNLKWPVKLPELKAALGTSELGVINDFVALAYGLPYLKAADQTALHAPEHPETTAPSAILGPGTGLGAAIFVPGQPLPNVVRTEAGQASFAPTTDLEMEILKVLRHRFGHVAIERILSGPGLYNLYLALGAVTGQPAHLPGPESVSAAALGCDDPLAQATLKQFCATLGSAAADYVLAAGAHGGLYLAGGILPKIKETLVASEFLARFTDKGPMGPMLRQVPVSLIDQGHLGVLGAAGWFFGRRAPGPRDLQPAA